MVGQEILEVLYSPVKAFKKIIEKPDFKGVAVVLLLVIASAIAVQYVASSKQFLELQVPEDEIWTEELFNQHVWTSNGVLSRDAINYQVGNSSIQSAVTDSTFWLKLTAIEPINCSEGTEYTELFFWMNWTHDAGSRPVSGTIKLFSGSEDSYFERDLAVLIGSNNEWSNVTLSIGSGQGWDLVNSPDWENITGVEFDLNWADSANLSVNVDALVFRTFASSVQMGTVYIEFISTIIQAGMTWVVWGGLLILVAKLFNEDLGKWNVFFIIIGYVFMVTVVTNLITAIVATNLPDLTYLLDPTSSYYYARNAEVWVSNLGYQLLTPLLWVGYIWTTGLSALVIHEMKEIPWGKALTIAVIAFAARLVLSAFGF
ncbi:MAG: hypothetical protein NUK63_01715 [Candidatus Bathyarchaeum tardum]|nr:MAG: hypothetical protein NUK63_01715 [Candidatus Bathyarchaeum tardum]